jgi:hypothetical protein
LRRKPSEDLVEDLSLSGELILDLREARVERIDHVCLRLDRRRRRRGSAGLEQAR